MTIITFTKFLRVLDASFGLQGSKILFVDSCATSPQYIFSTEHKISILSVKLDMRDACHEEWIWLDAEQDVDFSS